MGCLELVDWLVTLDLWYINVCKLLNVKFLFIQKFSSISNN